MKNLEEEIICGFKVTKKRKLLWEIELDMVKEVIRICGKYGLKYFATGGTLLGAVRHKGFIPWDDDIDFGMLRKDYNKFLEVAQSELPERYFVQHCSTEKKCTYGHIKIRNNNTACFSRGSLSTDLKSGKNHGVFIDIFPLDNVPNDRRARHKFEKAIRSKKKWAERERTLHSYKLNTPKNIAKYFLTRIYFWFHDAQKLVEEVECMAQKYDDSKSDTIAMVSFMPGAEAFSYPARCYEEFITVPFEDIEIVIPASYDELLKKQYGDYMQFPVKKDGSGSIHGKTFYDLDRPYTYYKNYSLEALRELINNSEL